MKKIKIEVEELSERAMYLHQHLGNGTLGKTEFDADVRLPDMSVVVKVGGKRYLVSSQAVIRAVIEAHENDQGNNKQN